MTYKECKEIFILYVSSYSSSATIEYYKINLRLFSEYLEDLKGSCNIDINEITKDVYIGYIAYQRNRDIKKVSVRTYARAIKVFLRYCFNEGYMNDNVTMNVKFPKSDKKIVVPLSSFFVRSLHTYIELNTLDVYRNLLIFYLMLDSGLRLGEVVNLDLADFHFAEKYIVINDSKNGKSRVVPMSNKVYVFGSQWKSFRNNMCAAFIQDKKGDRISKYAIHNMFYKMKKVCKDIHPHLLRHTFATSYIVGGGSLEKLRVLMGHEDYNVTRQYLHIASQVQVVNLDIYKLDDVFFEVYNYRK